jgi:GNAT superfamily N-acetyltransferase
MSYRIVKVTERTIPKLREAVIEMNLETTAHTKKRGEYGSGAYWKREWLIGGYLVYHNSKVIGWGALFEDDDEAHLFIHRNHRRQGLGTKIVKRFQKEHPDKVFCPWNRRVQGFFNKRNVHYVRRYLEW